MSESTAQDELRARIRQALGVRLDTATENDIIEALAPLIEQAKVDAVREARPRLWKVLGDAGYARDELTTVEAVEQLVRDRDAWEDKAKHSVERERLVAAFEAVDWVVGDTPITERIEAMGNQLKRAHALGIELSAQRAEAVKLSQKANDELREIKNAIRNTPDWLRSQINTRGTPREQVGHLLLVAFNQREETESLRSELSQANDDYRNANDVIRGAREALSKIIAVRVNTTLTENIAELGSRYARCAELLDQANEWLREANQKIEAATSAALLRDPRLNNHSLVEIVTRLLDDRARLNEECDRCQAEILEAQGQVLDATEELRKHVSRVDGETLANGIARLAGFGSTAKSTLFTQLEGIAKQVDDAWRVVDDSKNIWCLFNDKHPSASQPIAGVVQVLAADWTTSQQTIDVIKQARDEAIDRYNMLTSKLRAQLRRGPFGEHSDLIIWVARTMDSYTNLIRTQATGLISASGMYQMPEPAHPSESEPAPTTHMHRNPTLNRMCVRCGKVFANVDRDLIDNEYECVNGEHHMLKYVNKTDAPVAQPPRNWVSDADLGKAVRKLVSE